MFKQPQVTPYTSRHITAFCQLRPALFTDDRLQNEIGCLDACDEIPNGSVVGGPPGPDGLKVVWQGYTWRDGALNSSHFEIEAIVAAWKVV